MKVDYKVVEQLRNIKNLIEKKIQEEGKENDILGVDTSLVKILTKDANRERDIALGFPLYGTYSNLGSPDRFNIEDVAHNKFARYLFYELIKKNENSYVQQTEIPSLLRKEIGGYANALYNLSKNVREANKIEYGTEILTFPEYSSLDNWFYALELIAHKISNHWGTPLEAVE